MSGQQVVVGENDQQVKENFVTNNSRVRYVYYYEPVQRSLDKLKSTNQKGDRVLTVAYNSNKETGEVNYGASMFLNRGGESWGKKESRKTALNRLQNKPVIFHVKPGTNLSEVVNEIRLCVRVFGVSSKKDLSVWKSDTTFPSQIMSDTYNPNRAYKEALKYAKNNLKRYKLTLHYHKDRCYKGYEILRKLRD